ncbi:MAG: ERF family protein [bacterium]|jgi:hypothetical protein
MKLVKIQNELKAPKTNFNKFGNYNYRSAEDIESAVKPLLQKYNCQMFISDVVKCIDGMHYIESTVTFLDETREIYVSAQAGIDPTQKGMTLAQCFGSSSSYARKYALGGLFLIDDVKDADATNNHQQKPAVDLKKAINEAKTYKELADLYNSNKEISQSAELTKLIKSRKDQINDSAV